MKVNLQRTLRLGRGETGMFTVTILFILVIDWVMKTATKEKRNGIQWTMLTQLDDLDFADDLALLSHSHRQMQDKTTELALISAQVGLKINKKENKNPEDKCYLRNTNHD